MKKKDRYLSGARLQAMRQARGLTQYELAELMDVSTQFLSDAERGKVGMSTEAWIRAAKILKVSLNYLLMGEEIYYDENEIEKEKKETSLADLYQRCNPKERALIKEVFHLIMKSFE